MEIIKGETVLFGVIQRVGGATPKIVLRQYNGKTLHITASEEIAREAGARLYTGIGLNGIATWSTSTNEIISFKVNSVLEYEDKGIVAAFNDLRNRIGKYWDEVDNIEEFNIRIQVHP